MSNASKIAVGEKVPVTLTVAERDLIVDHTLYPESEFGLGTVDGQKIRFRLDLDGIEELVGYIAAEANHTDDSGLEKRLNRLATKRFSKPVSSGACPQRLERRSFIRFHGAPRKAGMRGRKASG